MFFFNTRSKKKLDFFFSELGKDPIIEAICKNDVTIVIGETGSGKTTHKE
jgi:ABC-type oligopeptide transport system ATPase subunit